MQLVLKKSTHFYMSVTTIEPCLLHVTDLEPHDSVPLDQIVVDTDINLFRCAGRFEILHIHTALTETVVFTNITIHDLDPELPVSK